MVYIIIVLILGNMALAEAQHRKRYQELEYNINVMNFLIYNCSGLQPAKEFFFFSRLFVPYLG